MVYNYAYVTEAILCLLTASFCHVYIYCHIPGVEEGCSQWYYYHVVRIISLWCIISPPPSSAQSSYDDGNSYISSVRIISPPVQSWCKEDRPWAYNTYYTVDPYYSSYPTVCMVLQHTQRNLYRNTNASMMRRAFAHSLGWQAAASAQPWIIHYCSKTATRYAGVKLW